MSVVYKDAIVLFLNQDDPILLNEKQMMPLVEFAQRNRMKVGISQPFSDILKINIYYQQANNVLEIGEVQEPEKTCYPATELLPHYLFSNCSYTELEVGIHHHIFWLQDYDERYHTDFIETLRTYLECDRSAAKAAEKLHLHRSTFFYRIKKLEELLDVDLNDSKLLFLYELSFKIWDYLSK
jgi:DNA-binding PucR family transcriptional regulator